MPTIVQNGTHSWRSNDWRNYSYDDSGSRWNKSSNTKLKQWVCNGCDTRNPPSWKCTVCEAKWDWIEGCDSNSTRYSDEGIWEDRQKRQVNCAVETDQRRAELEEKTRFAASFKTTCVGSTEYYKLADDVSSETGMPTKGDIQNMRQECQESKDAIENNVVLGET